MSGLEFDGFTVVLLLTPDDPPELDEKAANELQDAHLNHLAQLHEAGHLLAAGPLLGGEGRSIAGSASSASIASGHGSCASRIPR